MTIATTKTSAFGTYQLAFYDGFTQPELDRTRWVPYYLPQWSSRAASQPRYTIAEDTLVLKIDHDQQPWCPEFNGKIRVSSLQTGLYAGPLGSRNGQHRFSQDCIVREEQTAERLYTPHYGYIELRARCEIARNNLAALWMIGFEERPEQSAEICIFELKGWNIAPDSAIIGYGVHPFGDPRIRDEFYEDRFAIDVRAYHTYAAEWTATAVHFYIDGRLTRTIDQSPDYPMQLMLNIYDLEGVNADEMRFYVDYVAGYQIDDRGA